MLLKIEHTTRYRYSRPVEFTPHRLRLLPRPFPDLKVVSASIVMNPDAQVRWSRDAEDNPVGTATLVGLSQELLIESRLVLERTETNPFNFVLEDRILNLPLAYTSQEFSHLTPYLGVTDPRDYVLREWLSPFLSREGGGSNSTLSVLIGINGAISSSFRHVARHDYGVRTPRETITRGEGTCRDFALMLMESARSLGIAARYVSGYLCGPPGGGGESHTHGWCELYLPGAGWLGFDPANGILADSHHVPVAVSAMAGEIPPVEGAFLGRAEDFLQQEVTITALELAPWEEP
jgi:transglutaminase-like putative cysteine protease